MRARNKGRIVYRHAAGLLRIVRGKMLLRCAELAYISFRRTPTRTSYPDL
jgi:hypothetical protein